LEEWRSTEGEMRTSSGFINIFRKRSAFKKKTYPSAIPKKVSFRDEKLKGKTIADVYYVERHRYRVPNHHGTALQPVNEEDESSLISCTCTIL
jgi:hypothetical protein